MVFCVYVFFGFFRNFWGLLFVFLGCLFLSCFFNIEYIIFLFCQTFLDFLAVCFLSFNSFELCFFVITILYRFFCILSGFFRHFE